MSESRTSAVGTFGKAQAPAQKKCWIEIQLTDENGNAVANMPWRGENEATRDKVIKPYSGVTDSEGILRIDDLLHPDLTLFVEAQPLVDEMEQRPLSIERTYSYSMKMSPVTTDKVTNNICYYVVVGQLCDKAPDIPDWNSKELPAFHFPDPDFSGLTISNMYFNSRVIVKICPFRTWNILLHHTNDYSIVNGFNLGLLANLAYESQQKIMDFFNKDCLDLSCVPLLLYPTISIDVPFRQRYVNPVYLDTTVGPSGEGGTQLFYVSNATQLIVSWRGTEADKFADIIADGSFRSTPCPNIISGGRGHKGFLNAYELAVSKFDENFNVDIPKLSRDRELFITGHSLGGALTLIQAAVLKSYNPLIYTYGMPRIFSVSTISQLDEITHFRHVNDSDSVTSVPPAKELDNELYDKWGPDGVIYGFAGSVSEMLIQSAGVKFGDPYGHHGNIVVFMTAEQSSLKTLKYAPKILDLFSPDIMIIREVLVKRNKFFLVPLLNDCDFQTASNSQAKFVKCIDERSMEKYFPKNTNPELDSLTNPMNHFMSDQYLPFLNNELIELIDPNREMERKKKREEFSEQVERISKLGKNVSQDEVNRNKMFLVLQDMLPRTLNISQSQDTWSNSLIRFKKIAKEDHEYIN
ncbi:lipase family protein [Cronobacter turicensis]|uniref:lipase family protein n=1 Tax=Cronobacter turicensis TaxID=413502 RepID=UPI0024AE3933|nr:lipase family protein [Cronobacter turicensis]MDI6431513.1 lipase family protein [Cronobacter turicensis]